MNVTLCVVFGSKHRAVVWAGTYETDNPPSPGQSTEIHLHAQRDMRDEYPESILTEVVHSEISDEGTALLFLYAGEELPDAHVTDLLEASQWIPMSEDQAQDIMDVVDSAPPMAYTHDVLLVVGSSEEKDETGSPVLEAWNRSIAADDPLIPMFGERLFVDVLDAFVEEDIEDMDEEDDVLDESESESSEGGLILSLEMEANENNVGSGQGGLPAVVVYAAKVDPGEAQVAFWVSSLGDITGFDLVAAGWEKMTPETFDSRDFRLSERVDLARRTRIYTDLDEDGEYMLADYELENAGGVLESQYELLPSALVEHCVAAKEMLRLDDIVSGWVEQSGSEEDSK